MPKLATTSLKLDEETRQRVQKLADVKRRSANWLMREAIERYVAQEEQREKLRQDALAAWAEFEATGLHVTAQEADAWLAELEAGADKEPPACHV
mgnify:CR=1 FL=1